MFFARTAQGGARPWRSRRFRLLTALLLVTLAFSVTTYGATAGTSWCRSDPVLLIDGDLVSIFVAGPLTAPLEVTGPTKVIIAVPEGVQADLLLTDLGFGRGWDVSIEESPRLSKSRFSGTEVMVSVYVPAKTDDMTVRVEFAPRVLGILFPESSEGTSNSWVHLKGEL